MSRLLFWGLLPVALCMFYICKMSKNQREPAKQLAKCFLFGMLSVIPATVLELSFEAVLKRTGLGGLSYVFMDTFLVVAISEELSKYYFFKASIRKNKSFDCVYDGIIYSAFASLGFAAFENLMYIFEGELENAAGMKIAYSRMFTSIPAHLCFAVYWGYFYAKSLKTGKKIYRFAGLFTGIILHGAYDFCIFSKSLVFILLLFPFFVGMVVMTVVFIYKSASIKDYWINPLNDYVLPENFALKASLQIKQAV